MDKRKKGKTCSDTVLHFDLSYKEENCAFYQFRVKLKRGFGW